MMVSEDPSPPSPRDTPELSPDPSGRASGRWKRIGRRLLARTLVVLLVASVIAGLFGAWALGSESGRAWLLRQVALRVERASGWWLAADIVELGISEGRLGLANLELGVQDQPPFLAADGVRVEVDVKRLWDGEVVVRDALARAPVVDLEAPLPTSPEDEAADDGPVAVPDVLGWRIEQGAVRGTPTDGWLRTWRAADLVAAGSLVGGALDLELEEGTLVLEKRERSDLPLPDSSELVWAVGARLRGPLLGPYSVDDLEVVGDGVELRARATVDPEEGRPILVAFDAELDPSRLLPPSIVTPSSENDGAAADPADRRLKASGELDLRRVAGRLEVRGTDLPMELFEPLLGSENLDLWGGRGSRLDLDGKMELAGVDRATGTVDLAWRRAGEPLLEARLELPPGSPSTGGQVPGTSPPSSSSTGGQVPGTSPQDLSGPLTLAFDARLLPRVAGTRRASGRLLIPTDGSGALDPAASQLSGGRLSVADADASRLLAALEQRWPGLVADLPAPLRALLDEAAGPVELKAGLRGGLFDPRVEAELRWRPFAGRPAEGGESELAQQSPLEMNVVVTGRPLAGLGGLEIRSTLRAEDFALAEAMPVLEALSRSSARPPAVASLDGRLSGELSADLTRGPSGGLQLSVDTELEGWGLELGVWMEDGGDDGDGEDGQVLAVRRAEAWQLAASVDLPLADDGTPDGSAARGRIDSLRASEIDLPELAEGPIESLAELVLRASLEDRRLSLVELSAELEPRAEPGSEGSSYPIGVGLAGEVDLEAVFEAGTLPASWQAQLTLERPLVSIERLEAELALEGGVLRVELMELLRKSPLASSSEASSSEASSTSSFDGSFVVFAPLGALGSLPSIGPTLDGLPWAERGEGTFETIFELPELDSRNLEPWAAFGDAGRFRGSVAGSLELDPQQPTAAFGQWVLGRARLTSGEREIEALGTLRLDIADYRLELEPVVAQVDDHLVEVSGAVELNPDWRLDHPPAEAVRSVDVSAAGTAALDAFAPYLAGGAPEGTVDFEFRLSGPPEALEGTIEVDGPNAGITWSIPYATRLEAPKARLRLEGSGLRIEEATARWNDGTLDLEGTVDLGGEALGIDVKGYFDSLRYRLDYGLTTLSTGNFAYRVEPGRPGSLEVALLVERGFLRRNIFAGRTILNQLLAPPALDVPMDPELAATRLSIDVATVDGVRVKNNLANLHASWSPLRIEGTLGRPRVEGSIEVTPGGRLYVYGQVLRLDRASLQLSGDPSVPSRIDLETTSSIEDPSLATPEDQQLMAALAGNGGGLDTSGLSEQDRRQEVERQLASGLGTHFGNQLASRLSRSLSGTRLSYQPLWIYSEADTGSQLVISQELSRHVSLAVALDLDEAERQTYLVDFHGFRLLPSFSGTLFTNDESDFGVTLQQQLQFGGEPVGSEWPRLRKIDVSCPVCDCEGCPSPRRIAALASYERDDSLPDGSDFAIEIDIVEGLADTGWPEARARAHIRTLAEDPERADVKVEVSRLGARLEVEYLGEKPPRQYRKEISSLYRGGYDEAAALEEIRRMVERIWRSRGHVEPGVEVGIERVPGASGGKRILRIDSEPGPKVKLGEPEIVGLDDAEALELVRQRLGSTQARIELATAQPDGDARIVDTLRSLGFGGSKVVGREVDLEAGTVRVEVDPGHRPSLASVSVEGLPDNLEPTERQEVLALLELEAGAPAVPGEIGGAGLRLERALRKRGYADAQVRPVVVEPTPPDPAAVPDPGLRFEVEAGARQRLASVEIVGARHTGSSWAKRKADLGTGELLDTTRVAAARRRLLESQLFETVRVTTDTDESGEAEVTFDLEERPRYSLAYGLRWENEGGFGGVVDALDRNVTGRGIGLGLRALWLSDRRSSRLYSVLPKVLGSNADLELSIEGFRSEEDDLLSEGLTFSGQLAFPLGRRLEGRVYGRWRTVEVQDLDPASTDPALVETSTPVVGFQLILDLRDDPLDPGRGVFASLDLSTSPRLEQEDEEYFDRVFGRLSYYLPLGDGRLTWAQSVRLGLAEVGGDLPREFRFFAGGQYSVRGYDSRSLGPRESLSDGRLRELGGEATAVFNQELRWRWNEVLQTLIFLDAGQVWEDLDDARLGDLRQGVGLGLRYRSPLGLIRLDLAHPLDARLDDDEIAVYLGFGQAF